MFSAWWPEILGNILSWRPDFGDRMMEWLGWFLQGPSPGGQALPCSAPDSDGQSCEIKAGISFSMRMPLNFHGNREQPDFLPEPLWRHWWSKIVQAKVSPSRQEQHTKTLALYLIKSCLSQHKPR